MRKRGFYIILILVLLAVLLFTGYASWNASNPQRTCASCHEIVPSLEVWQQSAHREVTCVDCHGTAFSNGMHSLREKAGMLFGHFGDRPEQGTVHLDEEGVLSVMEACVECHREEYRSWQSAGHSATYADIFLNEKHNHSERLYPDCFRCHGMYYSGTIETLVQPISKEGPWHLTDASKASQPVIPCLVCHPIHMENSLRGRAESLDDPDAIYYEREARQPLMGLYLRSDKIHLRADMLPRPDMYRNGEPLLVSDEPAQRLCMQCHAPNWAHEAGTEDDKTPFGVHEGLSCLACHQGHSSDPRGSCNQCHPALSNCGLDVMTMNTTYASRESPHDIHFVGCTDCHDPIPYP
ncbi:MAG: multiheme c-type cytochrome [Bacteroidales bacterium]